MASKFQRFNDLLIIHSLDVYGFSQQEVDRLSALLRQADQEIRTAILSLEVDVPLDSAGYLKLLKNTKAIEKAYRKIFNEEIDALLKVFIKEEKDYYNNLLDNELSEYADIKKDKRNQSDILNEKIYLDNGEVLEIALLFDSIMEGRLNNLISSIDNGYQNKLSLREIADKLVGNRSLNYRNGLNSRYYNNLDANLKTVLTNISNNISAYTMNKNGDIVRGYRWDAILDGKTSDICLNLNGGIWYFDNTRSTLPYEIYPPAHYRCRSGISYIFFDWKTLGLDDTPENRELFPKIKQPVESLGDWFQRQSEVIQKSILGTTRYKMWKDSNMNGSEFFDLIMNKNTMRRYTIEELIERGVDIPKIY